MNLRTMILLTECCLVWRNDVIVDDRGQMQSNIVLGHADLLWHLDDLNFDIDLNELLAERIDLDETWIDSSIKASKLGDKTDIALIHWLIGIRADNATRNGSQTTDTRS